MTSQFNNTLSANQYDSLDMKKLSMTYHDFCTDARIGDLYLKWKDKSSLKTNMVPQDPIDTQVDEPVCEFFNPWVRSQQMNAAAETDLVNNLDKAQNKQQRVYLS